MITSFTRVPHSQQYPARNVLRSQKAISSVNHARIASDQVLLATAVVKIKDQSGSYHLARALLDSGSQVNFITEELAKQLKLERQRSGTQLLGIANCQSSVRHSVQTSIASRTDDLETRRDFGVLRSISSYQPEKHTEEIKVPENVQLADPQFQKPQRIDLLLGADIFFDILREGKIKGPDDSPTLQLTAFGWIVSGRCRTLNAATSSSTFISVVNDDTAIDSIVANSGSWKKSQIQLIRICIPQSNNCARSHLWRLFAKLPRVVSVSLPFKSSPHCLGTSYETAKRRFLALERRMSKQEDIRPMYIDFMKEYLALGHMSPTDNRIPREPHYFIPYQSVLRPHSASTKLRVLFDASSKSSSQLSLNDLLMVGPTIQPQLWETLLRFRLRPWADIAKMYRQIELDESHRNFQLIVWRETPTNLSIKHSNVWDSDCSILSNSMFETSERLACFHSSICCKIVSPRFLC
ncbi:uncharacterized protein LOC116804701 [Drosophila mojavensis]|uniref:uncharacterized protein LOC116804701 n=1 Tax=Drosophila mojavensis TaxID=7230 RepID=UPI0013EE7F1A|nr:uncharacterized protein LOC116804701 [Drosophila mojavensis]